MKNKKSHFGNGLTKKFNSNMQTNFIKRALVKVEAVINN